MTAVPRPDDGSAAATATAGRVYETANGTGRAAASTAGMDATASLPSATAAAANDGSTYWIRLKQSVRSHSAATSTTTGTHGATVDFLPSGACRCASAAFARTLAATDDRQASMAGPGEEGRWTELKVGRSVGEWKGRWLGYVWKYRVFA
jgi:hypothetical protein